MAAVCTQCFFGGLCCWSFLCQSRLVLLPLLMTLFGRLQTQPSWSVFRRKIHRDQLGNWVPVHVPADPSEFPGRGCRVNLPLTHRNKIDACKNIDQTTIADDIQQSKISIFHGVYDRLFLSSYVQHFWGDFILASAVSCSLCLWGWGVGLLLTTIQKMPGTPGTNLSPNRGELLRLALEPQLLLSYGVKLSSADRKPRMLKCPPVAL